jgi:deoxycytidylate deaminase
MRKIDTKFLALAHKESLKGEFRYKHGALIVRNKEILATGYNRDIGFNNVLSRYGCYYSIHAELDAIRKLPYNCSDSLILYSVRSSLELARPCAKCLQVISRTPVKRIVFSVSPGFYAEMFI